MEQKITGFPIVHINQNGFFPKNSGVFVKVLNIFKAVQPFPPFEPFKALFVFGWNIAPEQLHCSNPPPFFVNSKIG